MKKFVLAPALAALAMFFWGFAYWGAPHHLPYKALGQLPDEAAVAAKLGELFPATGAYLIPHPMKGDENMVAQMKRGPTVEVHITKESLAAMNPGMMVKGYFHGFVVCVLLMVMLTGLAKAFTGWSSRVKFCAGVGLLVAMSDVGAAIWWNHALGWSLAQAFYDITAYAVAGLVLARFAGVAPTQNAPDKAAP